MPQFCPSEKVDTRLPTIYVSKPDLLVVLNRLLKLKLRQDQVDPPQTQYFSQFTRSLMRREEFKLAVEIFGYRDVDLPPAYAPASIQTLKQALEGRGS
jgi:hypothetical protein